MADIAVRVQVGDLFGTVAAENVEPTDGLLLMMRLHAVAAIEDAVRSPEIAALMSECDCDNCTPPAETDPPAAGDGVGEQ